MTDHEEIICAYLLDGKGSGQALSFDDVNRWTPDQGVLWVHFDATRPETEAWLRDSSRLDNFIVESMVSDETRPRCDVQDNGVLMNLRGVNLNPGADPEDMVSIRIWFNKDRIISTRLRRLLAVDDIRQQLETNRGPLSTSHLVARLADRLTDRMGPVIDDLSDRVGMLEEQILSDDAAQRIDLRSLRRALMDTRQETIVLNRYISPQRHAVNTLAQIDDDWIGDKVRGRLRDTVDRVTRLTEELGSLRERAIVVQDELTNKLSQRMERTMYVLTIVATIMLPLGFLTGLLGINVGGMPGSENAWAFWLVCALCGFIAFAEIWYLKRKKLI